MRLVIALAAMVWAASAVAQTIDHVFVVEVGSDTHLIVTQHGARVIDKTVEAGTWHVKITRTDGGKRKHFTAR